jgi:hypothetical protein
MASLTIPIGTRSLKFKGQFVFKELYQLIYRFLQSKKFVGDPSEKFNELFHIIEYPTPEMRNEQVKWSNTTMDADYFQKKIDVTFVILGLKKDVLVRNNERFEVEKGEITISLDATLFLDPDDIFQKSFIRQKYFDFLWKPWNGKLIKQTKDAFLGDLDKLADLIKEFFELQDASPGEVFVPKKGVIY